jgi:hypothetical protein
VFESGRVSAELKEGGIEVARSGTATAQQAVQGVPAQQLPGHPELLDDGERDAATDIENWGAALGAACSGTSFSGGVTWCATGTGAGWWPAWAEATDGASRSTTMTAAAPTTRANRCFIAMPSTYYESAVLTRCICGVSESRVFPLPDAASYKSSSRNRHLPAPAGGERRRSTHTGCFSTLASTGILRRRLPVAAKIALATAGTMADVPASPIPPGGSELWTM